MADSILSSLWDWVSPKAAEAKVTPLDAQSRQYVQDIATQHAPDLDALRTLLYRTVLQKAEAEPAEATVEMSPLRSDQYGQYTPEAWAVELSTRLPEQQATEGVDPKSTLVHELLHFLGDRYGYTGAERQHGVIDYLLGPRRREQYGSAARVRSTMGAPLGQMDPGIATPETYDFLRRLFSGTVLESDVSGRLPTAAGGAELGAARVLDPYRADWLSPALER